LVLICCIQSKVGRSCKINMSKAQKALEDLEVLNNSTALWSFWVVSYATTVINSLSKMPEVDVIEAIPMSIERDQVAVLVIAHIDRWDQQWTFDIRRDNPTLTKTFNRISKEEALRNITGRAINLPFERRR
jgi:hypothetical protein